MGGAVSSITGGDFKSGAIAAGASQAMAGALNSTFNDQPNLRQAFSQIVGLTAAGLAGADINKASWVALMAEEYNRQLHQKEVLVLEKLQEENPEKAYQLKAAACAIVHCSASVHPDDQKNYDVLTKLEADGSGSRMLKARCSLPELLTSIRNGIRSTTACCAMKKVLNAQATPAERY
jgi:filamentous hemagglutinin